MSHANDSNEMNSSSDLNSAKETLSDTLEKIVSITIARKPFATIKEQAEAKTETNKKPFKKAEHKDLKQGGFVIGGHDGAELNLMTTQGGLNALRIFTQIGELKPLYLNQAFFDSI